MSSSMFPALIVAAFLICTTATSYAIEVLGTGTASLLGGDLTDVDDVHDEDAYNPPADFGGFDAEFFSSDEPGFGGGEFAFNVFDNAVGPGNDKWCCGTAFPQFVGARFAEPFFLTHFTVASGNDTDARRPRVWTVDGSNDGLDWTMIFSQDDPDAPLWTEHNQVIRFDSGADFPAQATSYSQFRLNVTATGATTGAFFQVNEFELFGDFEPRTEPYLPAGLPGPSGGAGFWGVREITGNGVIDTISAATDSATNGGGTITDGQFPILDVTDPDTNAQGGPILSGDPFPFLSNTGADDDHITTVAKGRIKVEQGGDYTFQVNSNDGSALRIVGKEFTSATNGGIVDPLDTSTMVRVSAGRPLGVVNLEPGEYDVEFMSWENTGEAFYEVTSALGAITDPSLAQWIAVGDPSSVAGFSKLPTVFMPDSADVFNMGSVPEMPSTPGGSDGGVGGARQQFFDGNVTGDSITEIIALHDPESGNNLGGTSTPFPADTPNDDNDFSTAVLGRFVVDNGNGVDGEQIPLTFSIQSDDNGAIHIFGASFESSNQPLFDWEGDAVCAGDFNSGNVNTTCTITLEEGTHEFEAYQREQGGGAYFQVWWAEGHESTFNSSDFTILSTDATPTEIPENTGLALVGEGVEPWPGDVNGDGSTDVADLNIIGINWQMSGKTMAEGDLTGDGIVDAADLNILGINWQTMRPAAAAVPEPSSVALLLAGLLASCGYLRKK